MQNGSQPQGRNGQPGPGQKAQNGRVNHMKVDIAKEAPDVMFGMFLVNSYLATVLFDTGASHAFISAQFVEKHSLNTSTMKNALVVKSPRGKMNTNVMCPGVRIKIRGVDFLVNPIVLKSEGIDMILGMRWLTKFKGIIQCAEKIVSLTAPNGKRIDSELS